MKWLNKWLLASMEKAVIERQQDKVASEYEADKLYSNSAASLQYGKISTIGSGSAVPKNDLESETAMRFTVHNASGGRVIQTTRHDRQRDRWINGMYVVTEEQDFGKAIDKIITMESLK